MAQTPQELRIQRQEIPPGATADDVAGIVRAILSLPVTVKRIEINDGMDDRSQAEIVWEGYFPKAEPPDGELPEPPPADLFEVLSRVPIEEIGKVRAPKLDMRSLRVVSGLLMMAANRRRAGVAWLTGNGQRFMEWLGVETPEAPTRFLGARIIEHASVPADRLVLLLAKSMTSDPLDADVGLSVVLDRRS